REGDVQACEATDGRGGVESAGRAIGDPQAGVGETAEGRGKGWRTLIGMQAHLFRDAFAARNPRPLKPLPQASVSGGGSRGQHVRAGEQSHKNDRTCLSREKVRSDPRLFFMRASRMSRIDTSLMWPLPPCARSREKAS